MRKLIFGLIQLSMLLTPCFLMAAISPFDSIDIKTRSALLQKYHLELVDKPYPMTWTELVGKAIISLLESLPAPVIDSLKNTVKSPIVLYKEAEKVPLEIDEFGVRKTFSGYMLPIYQKKDLLNAAVSENPSYSMRKKERITFLFDNNLIAADLSDLIDEEDQSLIERRGKYYLSYVQREIARLILGFYDDGHQVSETPAWRSISGWERRSFLGVPLPWMKDASNQYINGYAHPAGLAGPKDDFTTFGASYFATPITFHSSSIKCRIPRKYQFFKELFPQYQPYLDNAEFEKRGILCPDPGEDFSGQQFRDIHTGKVVEIGPVNEETVTGFELLYATPGDQEISEIAGHLLLRIKLNNNPRAAAIGIENPYDLVLAVFADSRIEIMDNIRTDSDATSDRIELCMPVAEEPPLDISKGIQMTMQALKGLGGLFLTVIQVDTLQHAVQQYTVNGNRSLMRYRLNLTDEQKANLLNHLYITIKNRKWRYYFFTVNCASLLVRIIGEGIDNREVVDYSPVIVPPNALVAMLEEKKVIEPVFPTIYSFTATAEIAQDIIKERLRELKSSFPVLKSRYWILERPDIDRFFSDEESRALFYHQLYLSAMQNEEIKDRIIYILQMAQKAELYYTWKEGMCFPYSTRAKGVARNALRILFEKYPRIQAVDIDKEIAAKDAALEEMAQKQGTHHTRLSGVQIGIKSKKSGLIKDRRSLTVGGAIYRQELGDHSYNAMQRGTYVDLGKFELDFSQNDQNRTVIDDWQLTALKIRKIKARRHYIPPLKLGLGFTVLKLNRRRWSDQEYKTLLAEGEVISCLVSSRLNLDHLNISIGAGIESPWEDRYSWMDKIINKERVFDFPLKLDGLLTFGSDRDLQMRGELIRHYRFDELADIPHSQKESVSSARLRLQWRLPEIEKSEMLLTAGALYVEKSQKDETGEKLYQGSISAGLEINRW